MVFGFFGFISVINGILLKQEMYVSVSTHDDVYVRVGKKIWKCPKEHFEEVK